MSYYNENIDEDLTFLKNKKYYKEWKNIVKDILLNDEFQKRKLFNHHDGNVWKHCLKVSYNSFLLAKREKLDYKTCAIAGLLHDFYPYAYKYNELLAKINPDYVKRVDVKCPFFEMHGFVHAHEAAENAYKFFPDLVNDKVYSCIETHMFPLNVLPPKYVEGWIITYVDKKLSLGVIKEIGYFPGYIIKKIKILKS